jgi:phage protein D
VSAGGSSIAPIECTVHLSSHQSADTMDATLALDAPGSGGEGFWSDTAPLDIDVLAASDVIAGNYATIFSGECDNVSIQWGPRTVKISARDKTQRLLDMKTNEKWQNKTAPDIITDLAGRAGLGVQISADTQKAGLEFKTDRNRISDLDSGWNVVVRLARQMGAVAFVKGDTLFVQPVDENLGGNYPIFYQRPTPAMYAAGNFITLSTTRDLNLSKKVKVNHKSWRHEKGDKVESEWESDGGGSGELNFRLRNPNLQKDQLDKISEAALKEITSHERKLDVDIPGDLSVDPRMQVTLSGTGTGFDQGYLISDVTHSFSQHEGFRTKIAVRNKDSKRKNKQNK